MAAKQITCPFCEGDVLVKKQGRILSSVSVLLQRAFPIKIKTGLLDSYFSQSDTVSKQDALKGSCKACGGSKKITDPASKVYEKNQDVAQAYKDASDEIIKLENQLGSSSGGGNRYSIIQGNDLLEVGLGMNDAPSYAIIKDGGVRNRRLVAHGDLSEKGAAMFPEGARCNHIETINTLSSPGGHYTIKCSNKFSLLAGSVGIEMATTGPVNISGGSMKITGAELSIGTQLGPLNLEGEVINLVGKSIEVAPYDGDFFVKGTISNTGNLRVAGHAHVESVSFVQAECIGRNENTREAAPSDLVVGPAFYGGEGSEAQSITEMDMQVYQQMNQADPMSAQGMQGSRYQTGLSEKQANSEYVQIPYERVPTGYIIPGTVIKVATIQNQKLTGDITGTLSTTEYSGPFTITNATITNIVFDSTVTENVYLHNFPHVHALPDLKHTHTVRIPDIDCTSDTAEVLRGKQAGVEGPMPLHKVVKDVKNAENQLESTRDESFASSMQQTLNNFYSKKR